MKTKLNVVKAVSGFTGESGTDLVSRLNAVPVRAGGTYTVQVGAFGKPGGSERFPARMAPQ
jgi:hypothetical protein